MKRINLLVALCFALMPASLLLAQLSYTKVFYKYSHAVRAYSIVNTIDNYYLLAGEENNVPLVLKMDTLGNIVWSKTYGLQGAFFNHTVTNDSCYTFVGNIFNAIDSEYNIFCTKLNIEGDTLWSKEIDIGVNDWAFGLQQTNDNGFILSGLTSPDDYNLFGSNFNKHAKPVIARLDSLGNLMWAKTITASNFSGALYSIKQMPDSGFVAIGYLKDSVSPIYPFYSTKPFMLQIDPIGNIGWLNEIEVDDAYGYYPSDVLVSQTGLFCVYTSFDDGVILFKTDFSGNFLWGKQLDAHAGGLGFHNPFPKIHQCSDHDLILTTGSSFYKTDTTAVMARENEYFVGSILDCLEAPNMGFILLGDGPVLVTEIGEDPEIAILKTDSLGLTVDCCFGDYQYAPSSFTLNMIPTTFTDTELGECKMYHPQFVDVSLNYRDGCVDTFGDVKENPLEENAFTIFPNPSDGLFHIAFNDNLGTGSIKIEVYNTIGQKVYARGFPNCDGLSVNLNQQEDGIYFVRVKHNGELYSQRIIVNKKN
jgi:hypothetical protein